MASEPKRKKETSVKDETDNPDGESSQTPEQPVAEEETDNPDGESSQTPEQPVAESFETPASSPGCSIPLNQHQPVLATRPPLDKQEEEPHGTRSFKWRWKGDLITCNKERTVEESLQTDQKFRTIAKENKEKELVILRYGKAITPDFPCSLMKECTELVVKYIKAWGTPRVPGDPQRKAPSVSPLMFHIQTRGGETVTKIMRNSKLQTKFSDVTVYAFKGETVEEALRRDGRFSDVIFRKNCVLQDRIDHSETAMSIFVDDLNDKIFQILSTSDPVGSQISLKSYTDPPLQVTATKSVNANTPEQKPDEKWNMVWEIPNSKELQGYLSTQFKKMVEEMKTEPGAKPSGIKNLFRVEYGKNADTCREVKTFKTLMPLSDAVCQVRNNKRAEGSGFLLFDKFVLTNAHVLKNVSSDGKKLISDVTVHFSFESLGDGGQGFKVEEVICHKFGPDLMGQKFDWALLRITAVKKLPVGLLRRFGYLPQSGGICIIGHPDGGVKKIDPCLIVPTENFNQVVDRHRKEIPDNDGEPEPIQIVSRPFFKGLEKSVAERRLNYETCFYFGSSGSPVFDVDCNVVAMHTGGYVYGNAKGEQQSVIEFGYPLSDIILHIIVQLVEKGRFDVLKKYLACRDELQQNRMRDLKALVKMRNITAFKDAANNTEVMGNKKLAEFFAFIFSKEEPTPTPTGGASTYCHKANC